MPVGRCYTYLCNKIDLCYYEYHVNNVESPIFSSREITVIVAGFGIKSQFNIEVAENLFVRYLYDKTTPVFEGYIVIDHGQREVSSVTSAHRSF